MWVESLSKKRSIDSDITSYNLTNSKIYLLIIIVLIKIFTS